MLFEALSSRHKVGWWDWPAEYRDREAGVRSRVPVPSWPGDIERMKREQFAFAWQWARLREHAHRRGVRLFGDVPFYVAPDSAETWAHPEQFQLDDTGRATAVAGVPARLLLRAGSALGQSAL